MTCLDGDTLANLLVEVWEERERQHAKFGEQNHVDGTGYAYLREQADKARRESEAAFAAGHGSWRLILREEYREALAESDPAKLRAELIQVAAVAVAWAEAIDRRTAAPERPAPEPKPVKPTYVGGVVPIYETPTPAPTANLTCDLGYHRWAYTVTGSQACGYCGKRRY